MGSGCLNPAFSGPPNRAEMRRHSCILGGSQHQAWGAKSEVATSPLPSRGPKRGRKCYVTPAFSGIPNIGEQNQKWLPHPCLLWGPKEGRNATPLLHSRGSPMKSAGSKMRSGCLNPTFSEAQKRAEMRHHPRILGGAQRQARGANQRGSPTKGEKIRRGTKTQVAASPLPSRGPGRRQKCYVTLASRGSRTKGNQIRPGYLTLVFSGAQKRVEMLRQPCILGDPHKRRTKSELATLCLPSRSDRRGRKCYITPAFSGVPNAKRGEQKQKWLPHLPSRGPKRGREILRHPCILGGPQRQARGTKSEVATSPLPSQEPKGWWKCYVTLAFSGIPNKGEPNQSWLLHLPSRGPKRGWKCYVTPAFSGIRINEEQKRNWLPCACLLGGTKEAEMLRHPCILGGPQRKARGAKSEVATSLAFSGAQKRVQMLHHPYILGGPQRQARGAKSEVASSTVASRGAKRGRKCCITPTFSGIPSKWEQDQKWLPHPCLLGGPQRQAQGGKSEVATSPAFLGAQKRVEMLCHP